MDIVLQGDMDGIETVEKIKTIHDIPIVYLTAYSDDNTIQRVKMTNPSGYILKPFSNVELYSTIEIALYNQKVKRNLIKSEEKYRKLAEKALDGIYIISPSGFIYVNPAFEKMTGYSARELYTGSLDFYSLIHPDDRKSIRERVEKRKEGVTFSSLTILTLITRDRHLRKVEINTVPFPGEEGTVLGILRDITDRGEVDIDSRKCRKRYENLLDTMSSGIVVLERIEGGNHFVVKDVNTTAQQIEDIKREEVIGKTISTVFPRIQDLGLLEVLQKVWKTGKSEYYSVSYYEDEHIQVEQRNYVYTLQSGAVILIYDKTG
jgi:PAS domain S-box-containing protein